MKRKAVNLVTRREFEAWGDNSRRAWAREVNALWAQEEIRARQKWISDTKTRIVK